jgi:hypothetical protein
MATAARDGLKQRKEAVAVVGRSPTSVVCPVLVGRAAILEAIEGLLGDALSGRGRTALFAGEAGVGKSRLVAAVKERFGARSPAALVLEGHCFEPDRSLPYAPFLDLLRAHLAIHTPEEIGRHPGPSAWPRAVSARAWATRRVCG